MSQLEEFRRMLEIYDGMLIETGGRFHRCKEFQKYVEKCAAAAKRYLADGGDRIGLEQIMNGLFAEYQDQSQWKYHGEYMEFLQLVGSSLKIDVPLCGEETSETLQVEKRDVLDPQWLDINRITVGKVPAGRGTADNYYMITKDHAPFLVVAVYHEFDSPFLAHMLWGRFLCLGMYDHVICIDLAELSVQKFEFEREDLYFGQFYQFEDSLLIASSNRLYCLDRACSLVWKTAELAVDGVLVSGLADGVLSVSGEMDPPDGWVDYRVWLATGEIATGTSQIDREDYL